MDLYCAMCNKITVQLDGEAMDKIAKKLHGPADCARIECPKCHRYQWELASRLMVTKRDSVGG